MAAGDNLTVRIVGRYQSQNIVNTLHYNLSVQGSSDQDVCEAFAIAWDTHHRSAWLAAHSTAYELIGIKCFRLGGTAKTPGFSTIGEDGTRSGTPAPSSVCRTITLYTGSTNSRKRGRVMLSGSIVEDFSPTDGAVLSAARAVMNSLGDALLAGITANGDDGGDLILPPAGIDPEEPVTDYKSRVTPSSVTTRRIRQFLIG